MRWVIAQAAPTDPSLIPGLLQYGVLGIVIIAILLGWLWPKPSIEQFRKDKEATIERLLLDKAAAERRAERAEQQRDELAKELQNALPVMAETTTACRRMLPLLQELLENGPASTRR